MSALFLFVLKVIFFADAKNDISLEGILQVIRKANDLEEIAKKRFAFCSLLRFRARNRQKTKQHLCEKPDRYGIRLALRAAGGVRLAAYKQIFVWAEENSTKNFPRMEKVIRFANDLQDEMQYFP